MTNKEIAQILAQIAKILEIRNTEKNRFRIIAYERAAQTISNLTNELYEIYSDGGFKALNEIEGVGESIAEKIEELLKTGRLKYLKEIQEELPKAEVEFLRIPGVGPKMAVKLAGELKAKNIEDLKKKIKKGEADILIKEKTRNNILRGIEILSKLSDRLLITEALPIAEEVVNYLKKNKAVIKVDYVGSLRRMKETIGDIDIVATSTEPQKVIQSFVKMPTVDHIISQGEAKSTIIDKKGVQIDLEIVPSNEYGSLLQHFTGSKEHNVALRTLAQTQNKSVSEHGIKYSGKLHTFTTEKGVYEFLGLDEIQPELREDRGEIKAAQKHKLPKLVELGDLKGDLHVHSNWSDGHMTIEEIALAGEKLGYEYIVVSDHTIGLGIANGLDEERLEMRQKEIEKVQVKHPKIKLLSSVEVNIKANGDLDIKDEMLAKLDLVTASVHTSFQQDKDIMTRRLVGAIRHPHVDVIGHPSGRIIGAREPYEVDWTEIFKVAAEEKTALEISAFPNRLDLADYLVKDAAKYGVKFAINTDAHTREHLELMRYGVSVARRGWIQKESIVNTLSLDELENWLKSHV